ncbi:MAG: winged helix-turn-helix transcriptional regulator [Methanobrevibacter thaueri]|nr:winged helix-turn-helix transcriptional regulator [Methanobrevibacter thaueri]
MDDELLEIYVFVSISSYRVKTLKALYKGNKTPTEISKDSNIRVNHISNVLSDLKKYGLVICINEEKRKNRIYTLTDLGKKIMNIIKMN